MNFEMPTKRIEYKSASEQRLPSLEVPPDLLKPTADDRFVVPDVVNPTGTATFSGYNKGQQVRKDAPAAAGSGAVLPVSSEARVERAGNQRWLVVRGDPGRVWPVIKDFWQESGFIVNIEQPEAGVMETDWAENRAQFSDGIIRGVLGRALGTLYSTGERDKFRTRLERGAEAGTTEIYISHRGMEEVYAAEDKSQTRWQPRRPDSELEAEMLRRLMVRLGVDQERAKTQIASATAAPPQAQLTRGTDGAGALTLNEQFDRAWRRVGLALDRVGFTVEDRDRSKGLYFVRYIDPGIDNQAASDKGWFSRFNFRLWGSAAPQKNEQYRILVRETGPGTEVNVLNKEGAREQSETARRILSLLHDQLK